MADDLLFSKRSQNRLNEIMGGSADAGFASGTSIFDPVATELFYRWFSPPGAQILDCFAGGSVRGIVASKLDRYYTGIDLSDRQIAANIEQGALICPDNPPTWINGDSLNMDELLPSNYQADFVFSCPPYYDLEVYSNNPQDLSTMDYNQFLDIYFAIIAKAVAKLKPDRFAAFVVGDVRDKQGFYRNFPGATIDAFLETGAKLYNDIVLVTAVGSLPVRITRQFQAARKVGTTHQRCLVFVKGDPRRATQAIGDVEHG